MSFKTFVAFIARAGVADAHLACFIAFMTFMALTMVENRECNLQTVPWVGPSLSLAVARCRSLSLAGLGGTCGNTVSCSDDASWVPTTGHVFSMFSLVVLGSLGFSRVLFASLVFVGCLGFSWVLLGHGF